MPRARLRSLRSGRVIELRVFERLANTPIVEQLAKRFHGCRPHELVWIMSQGKPCAEVD